MRWFWIDRFTQFDSGRTATAIKNVSLAEGHLHDHFPGAPLMPNALVIEGIAQTAGLLVAQHGDFEERVVLAKVAKAHFHFSAAPGDTLLYRVTIDDIHKDGAIVSGTSHCVNGPGVNGPGAGGTGPERLQAEVQLFFAHLSEAVAGSKSLFDPASLLAMLKLMGIFDVGRDAQGQPLTIPPSLLLQAAGN
jgi:3-hydroxyacyl-[acyl-carrier-protein] dehydratase